MYPIAGTAPVALVVEDDVMQRRLVATLFEECELQVVECDTAEQALGNLDKLKSRVAVVYTDVDLGGGIDGVDLAYRALRTQPSVHLIVASGHNPPRPLPDGTVFMQKPILPLAVLREAERVKH
jgi:DNA-binding NtrC family response regulator